jgi:2-polyprenyl-3-methyl-5-hydroxy-6-metoxy-1,4-benzoquinol methylase
MAHTRGFGLLEKFLSQQRARLANSLIPTTLRSGKILDVGCGSSPYFLQTTDFAEKYGIDPFGQVPVGSDIKLDQRAFVGGALAYPDHHFQVITMLAVVEHIELPALQALLTELHRVLAPGGRLIMTTPTPCTDFILKSLARLHFLSPEEIDEHKDLLSLADLRRLSLVAGFTGAHCHGGYFELGLNQYFYADKPSA